ncbi:histidine kinase [Nocardia sp. NPDC048505]|uniref:sensor histidine kinase n=1 Tax=Nocardia sp. NPDC048505 TaxID=3155756 RepID=UPI0033D38AD8
MVRQPGWILVAVLLLGQTTARLAAFYAFAPPDRFALAGAAIIVTIMAVQGLVIVGRWWPRVLLVPLVALTFLPYIVFGAAWGPIAGIAAAGLALTLRPRLAWPLFGLVVLADSVVSGLLRGPLEGAVAAALGLNVGFMFFAIPYLARQLDQTAREQARLATAAVEAERLHTAARLRETLGAELGAVLRELRRPPSGPEFARVAELSRRASATARSIAGTRREPVPNPAATSTPEHGSAFAWWFVLAMVFNYSAVALSNLLQVQANQRPQFVLFAGLMVLACGLQLYHGAPRADGGAPRAWPWTLALHGAVGLLALVLPPWPDSVGFAPFLLFLGAVLVRLRTVWSWVFTAAGAVLLALTMESWGIPASPAVRVYWASVILTGSIAVYALCRVPEVAAGLRRTRAAALRMAVLAERLRVARDIHDVLGHTLTAITLDAELAARRPPPDPAAKTRELLGLADRALQDLRSIAAGPTGLSLAEELISARKVLEAAGSRVTVELLTPPPEHDVLAVVLREAVTNVVRHATPEHTAIALTTDQHTVRLRVTNDGAAAAARPPGSGLPNLTARLRAVGGTLGTQRTGDTFTLTALAPPQPQSQPASDASRTASTRLRAPNLLTAEAR